MKITYIHHSGFLVETDRCYYLFDYEKGSLPEMDATKQIFVLSSHGHHDHYNAEIFSVLNNYGMQNISAILSDISLMFFFIALLDEMSISPK